MTPLTLENSDLHFSIELPSGGWSLYSRDEGGGYVEGVRMGADYRMGSQPQRWAGTLDRTRSRPPVTEDSRHGPLQTLKLENLPNASGLALTLEFAMALERPFFLWRLTAHNRGAQPLRLDRLVLLAAGPACAPAPTWTQKLRHLFWRPLESRSTGSVRPNAGPGEPAFFTNGWQSWGYTGALGAGDHYPYTRLGPFTTPMKVNRGTPQPRRPGHFASDMFGVLADRTHRTGMLVGFLSQVRQFGSVEALVHQFAPSLKIWANGDGVAMALLPVVGRAARAVDWMEAPIPEKLILPMSGPVGDWWVIGLFNWEDRPRTLSLNLKDFGLSPRIPWHALDFWNQRYYYACSGEVTFGNIPAHGSVLLAVREAASDFGSLQKLPKTRASGLAVICTLLRVSKWVPGIRTTPVSN